MASPIYIWLNDESGNLIKGSSTVEGRENSIEAIDLQHEIFMPTDKNGKNVTGSQLR